MAIQLQELIVPIKADTDGFESGMSGARKLAQGFGKSVQTMGKVAVGGLGILAGGAAAAGGAIVKLASDAAPLQQVENAFNGMAEAAGTSGDEVMAAMQESSQGMIRQRDIMLTFNKASQLVSKDFGKLLPDAMGSLQKVAASTGEDMGFLLDSLVTGVGRLSPMILDNLGIQVDMVKANEDYAESIGKTVDELSKEEQQMALATQAIEKMRANTEAMPDATGSLTQNLEQFKVMVADTKDEIGKAFIPVMLELAQMVLPAVKNILPTIVSGIKGFADGLTNLIQYLSWTVSEGDYLNDFLANVPESIRPIVQFVGELVLGFKQAIGVLQSGQGAFAALMEILDNFLPDATIERIWQLYDIVAPVVERIKTWVQNNIQLKDVLVGLGVAIASVIVPAVLSFIGPILSVIAVFALITTAVSLLRQAWETNFLGIRDKTAVVVEWLKANVPPTWEAIRAGVATAVEWLRANVPPAWEVVRAKAQQVGDWLRTNVPPVWETIKTVISTILETIKTVISNWVTTAERFWSNHGEQIQSIISTAFELVQGIVETIMANIELLISAWTLAREGDWRAFGETMREIWDNAWTTMKETLATIGAAILGVIEGLIEDVKAFFTDTDWASVGQSIIDGVADGISASLPKIKNAAVNAAKAAWEAAKGFFGINSPARKGIILGRAWDEGLARGMEAASYLPAEAAARTASNVLQNTRQQFNEFNMTLHTRAERGVVERGFRVMQQRVPSSI